MQAPVREIPTTQPHVFAFEIPGEVSQEDMERMAARMNAAFEIHDKVNLLLLFDDYEGNELGALFDVDVIKTHFKSISHLDRYAIVGAPGHMDAALKGVAAVLPVEPKTFDKSDIAEAWAWVGAEARSVAA